MSDKKIILVAGATGAQGGSVAKALLAKNKFKVRVLTRNPASAADIALQRKGAEVVQGDLDNRESLASAIKDVYGVFGVTSFWEHFGKEYQHGINLVDAVHEAGVKHFVFSTLDNYQVLSKGQYSVPHYDMKAVLEDYTKNLGVPASFVRMSFYYEAFLNFFPPTIGEDRSYYFGFPQGNTRLAAVSVEDLGGVVTSVFDRPEEYIGKAVRVVGADITPAEYAATMSRVLNKNIFYNHVPRDVFASYGFPGAEDLANMFEVQRLYVPERKADMLESYRLNPTIQTFENWVGKNRMKFIELFNSQFQAMVI